jgi:DNA polymerase-3 subunit gamma/tau
MSYLVLARKYRPRRFDELVGQEHVVQALANALESQRLHHAYLFTGTRGVGKTTVSRILAKSLNCTGPDGRGGITATPCGACDACRDIDAGRHVDYVELDAASNRGVDEITQLLDQSVYKPVVGRFKVYMIDEVHMLSNHAFNAMLKTLEEPPEYLKFVLATTDPQKVPPTVLSRCLQFNLRPMAPPVVQQHLARVLGAESIDAEPGALRLLARAAHGSMRDALSLTDQAIAYGAGRLDEAGVRRMLGAVDRGHGLRILDALALGDGAALVAAADGLRALGLSATGLLEELASMLQQMAVLQAVPDAGDADDPDAPALVRLAAAFAPDETQLHYSIALHGREELALAPDEYSGLVMVLLRMLAFRPAGAPAQSVRPQAAAASAVPARAAAVAAAGRAAEPAPRVVKPEPVLSVEPAPSLVPPPVFEARTAVPAPSEPPAATPGGFGDRWAGVVGELAGQGAITALVRELAMQAECVAIDDAADPPLWRLRVERESLRAPAQRDRLEAALAAHLGGPVRLDVEAGVAADTPAQREATLRAARQAAAEQAIAGDPLVRSLMQQYKTARIVPGSVKPAAA